MRVKSLLVIAFAAAILLAQTPAGNPWIATWKLDILASHYHDDLPKQESLRVSDVNRETIAFHRSGTSAAGRNYDVSYRSTGDGKESALMDGETKIGTASYEIFDDSTINGKGEMLNGTIWTAKTTISDDKKTLTSTFHVKTAHGEEYDVTKVYKK
jgi:hypothetical protein